MIIAYLCQEIFLEKYSAPASAAMKAACSKTCDRGGFLIPYSVTTPNNLKVVRVRPFFDLLNIFQCR
jgi:hypothetical protein